MREQIIAALLAGDATAHDVAHRYGWGPLCTYRALLRMRHDGLVEPTGWLRRRRTWALTERGRCWRQPRALDAVVWVLLHHAGQWQTAATIAGRAGYTLRTVRPILAGLERAGAVRRDSSRPAKWRADVAVMVAAPAVGRTL